MKRFANIILLLIFALLQCIAPLAHAHINGSNTGSGVHLPEVEFTSAHGTGHARSVVETQDSGVMQDEGKPLDEYIAAHVFASGFMWQSVEIIATTPYYHAHEQVLGSPSTCSHRPYPHAPPASTVL